MYLRAGQTYARVRRCYELVITSSPGRPCKNQMLALPLSRRLPSQVTHVSLGTWSLRKASKPYGYELREHSLLPCAPRRAPHGPEQFPVLQPLRAVDDSGGIQPRMLILYPTPN